jgi:hypothetical protein
MLAAAVLINQTVPAKAVGLTEAEAVGFTEAVGVSPVFVN